MYDKYDNPGELRKVPGGHVYTALDTSGKLLPGFHWYDKTKYGDRVVQNLRGHCWKLRPNGTMWFYAGDYPT